MRTIRVGPAGLAVAAVLCLVTGCGGGGGGGEVRYEGDYSPMSIGSAWDYTGDYSVTGPSGTESGTFTLTQTVTGTMTMHDSAMNDWECFVLEATGTNLEGAAFWPGAEIHIQYISKRSTGTYGVAFRDYGDTLYTFPQPQLLVPSPLVTGNTWTMWQDVEGQLKCTYTVQTAQQVSVTAGTRQAVPLKGALQGAFDSLTVTGSDTQWYVVDIGQLKQEVSLTVRYEGVTVKGDGTIQLSSHRGAGATPAGAAGGVLLVAVIERMRAVLPSQ